MRCLVIDDEQLARKLVSSYIEKTDGLELAGECKSAIDAIKLLQQSEIDLLFLDIQMPGLTGLEFLKSIKNIPLTIITTAYSEYAVEGFELDAVDYLLKPFNYDRFLKAIKKAESRANINTINSTVTSPPALAENQHINIKADHRIYKVKYEDLLYIEGLKEYVTFHTLNEKIVALDSLKSLELKLPGQFLRIHKSYIINLDKVNSVYGNLAEIGKLQIPIGKSYKEIAMKRIFD